MSANCHELESAVLELTAAERMTLAERILESLPAEIPEVIEQQWIVEAERRWCRFQSGQAKTIDADEVFACLERRGT